MPDTVHKVAKFLQENPDFFVQYAELFSTLEVPHPHHARTISLGERQILTLRERLRDFEFRLAELVRNGALNEATTTTKVDNVAGTAGAKPVALPGPQILEPHRVHGAQRRIGAVVLGPPPGCREHVRRLGLLHLIPVHSNTTRRRTKVPPGTAMRSSSGATSADSASLPSRCRPSGARVHVPDKVWKATPSSCSTRAAPE